MKNELISHGPTFSGVISFFGILCIVIGGSMFTAWATVPFGVPFFLFGVLAFLSIKGLELDYEGKHIRIYHQFYLFRTGDWYDFEDFDTMHIKRFRERSTFFSRGGEKTFTANSFDVKLTGKRQLPLAEFSKHKHAIVFTQEHAPKMGYKVVDHVQKAKVASLLKKETGARR